MTQDGSLEVLEITESTIVFYTGDEPHEVKGLESLHPVKYRAEQDFTGQAGQALQKYNY